MNVTDAEESMLAPSIRLRPIRIVGVLGAIAVLSVGISFALQLVRYVGGHDNVYGLLSPAELLFDVDHERNVPTLISAFLLLYSASLLGLIALLKRRQQDFDLFKWTALTCLFIFLAIDEAWTFHEMLAESMRRLLGSDGLGIFYAAAWIIPGMTIVLILALVFWRFLLRLPSSTRWLFLGAGTIYLGGAVGVEIIGSRYDESHGVENLTYQLFSHIEESMEMGGIIVFIYALLRYLAEQYAEVKLLIDDHNQ